MAAPTIAGAASSAYTGYLVSDLIEHALNERGMTADVNSTEFTQASTAQKTKCRIFIKDGLAYLYSVRELYFPLRIATVSAEAQSNSKFGDITVPSDLGRIEAVYIGNVPILPLSPDEYIANLRPSSEGGGLYLADATGSPVCYIIMPSNTVGKLMLRVMPEQSTTFTATFLYRSSCGDLSDETKTVYLPIAMHPLMVLYTNYRWALDDGNIQGAMALWQHLMNRLEELSFQPPAVGLAPVIHSALPTEVATRF